MIPFVRCMICGDVLGVYEPVLVVGAKGGRTSSFAREPRLGSGDEMVMHRNCGIEFGSEAEEGPDAPGDRAHARDD